jgi:hypothetical protein
MIFGILQEQIITELYNGTSWTEVNDFNTARGQTLGRFWNYKQQV